MLFRSPAKLVASNGLFSFTMVFFASAIYNAAPGEVFAGILQGWQGGFAAGWESVTNLVTSSGIDGRLPVVLTCGTAIVLAMEHNGNNVARWIRKQCFVLRWTVYYAAAVSILFFAAFGQSAFIYQQFTGYGSVHSDQPKCRCRKKGWSRGMFFILLGMFLLVFWLLVSPLPLLVSPLP